MAMKDGTEQVRFQPQFVSDRAHVSRQAKRIVGSRRKLVHVFTVGCF
jgi:hypothetical protein